MKNHVGLLACSILRQELPSEKTHRFVMRVPRIFAAVETYDGFIFNAKGDHILGELP